MNQRHRSFIAQLTDFAAFLALRVVLTAAKMFPIEVQRKIFITTFSLIFAPVIGWQKRAYKNLSFAIPKLSDHEKRVLVKKICKNLGATLFEILTPVYLQRIAENTELIGPGVSRLEASMENGEPIILVSGHFGNYDIVRSYLIGRGLNLGALYRPLNNQWLNVLYERAISKTGTPLFPRNKVGLHAMLRHLKKRGSLALLIDQHMDTGLPLSFFGHRAYTSDAAAQFAMKYNMPLLPIYAIRQKNGKDFVIYVEKPIKEGSAADMTQKLNDSLETMIRKYIDQWAWPHNRWKRLRNKAKLKLDENTESQ